MSTRDCQRPELDIQLNPGIGAGAESVRFFSCSDLPFIIIFDTGRQQLGKADMSGIG